MKRMSAESIKDTPTVSTCPACKGRRRRSVQLLNGKTVDEVCSWCEGCGFIWPERQAEWEAYLRSKNLDR